MHVVLNIGVLIYDDRHSNNADKKFQRLISLNFKIINQKQKRNYYGDMDFNPVNQQLLR